MWTSDEVETAGKAQIGDLVAQETQETQKSFCEREHGFLFALGLLFMGTSFALGPLRTTFFLGSEPWLALGGFLAGVMIYVLIALSPATHRWTERNVMAVGLFSLGACFFVSGSILKNAWPDRVIVVNGARTSLTHKYLVATPFDDIRVFDRVWLITAGATVEREGGEVTVKVTESHTVQCVFPADERIFISFARDGKHLEESLRRTVEDAVAARHRGDFFPMFSPTDRMALEELVRIDLRMGGFPLDACTLTEPEMMTTARQVFARSS